jgi:AbiJ N-terminal domain 3
LHLGDYWWAGRLDQTAFLALLYPLRKLPSTDRRFQNAEGDIRQHRINNHDWEDDWVFYDTRFETNLQSSAQLLLNRPSRQCAARTIDRAAGVRN